MANVEQYRVILNSVSKNTSEIDNLSDENEDITCNIAILDREKRNIIEEIKKPIKIKIDEKEQNKTLQEKEDMIGNLIGCENRLLSSF